MVLAVDGGADGDARDGGGRGASAERDGSEQERGGGDRERPVRMHALSLDGHPPCAGPLKGLISDEKKRHKLAKAPLQGPRAASRQDEKGAAPAGSGTRTCTRRVGKVQRKETAPRWRFRGAASAGGLIAARSSARSHRTPPRTAANWFVTNRRVAALVSFGFGQQRVPRW